MECVFVWQSLNMHTSVKVCAVQMMWGASVSSLSSGSLWCLSYVLFFDMIIYLFTVQQNNPHQNAGLFFHCDLLREGQLCFCEKIKDT